MRLGLLSLSALAALAAFGASTPIAAAGESAMRDACRERAVKRLQASPDAISARSDGRTADRRRLVTGEVETPLGNRRFRCVFDSSGRRLVSFTAARPPGPGLSKRFSREDDDSNARAGRGQFDARGEIPCAVFAGQPMTRCPFAVARAGGGLATVVVTWPDGRSRALFFDRGKIISTAASQADGYGEVSARKSGDLNLISVGAERYEIPDAVLFGG